MNIISRFISLFFSTLFLLCLTYAFQAQAKPIDKWWEQVSPEIKEIKIKSPLDGNMQPALFYAPKDKKDETVPLMVILHSWSSSYDQRWAKNYGEKCIAAGWAFVRPHYRGPNNNPDATGSEKVVSDIVDAVEYAKKNAKIDEKRIFIAGDSGGGYTTLHMVGRKPDIWAGAIVGVPPTDLVDWYNYNKKYKGGYDKALIPSCGGKPGDKGADQEYKKRTPQTYLKNAINIPVDIKAGFYDKSVPFLHSIWAFNAIVPEKERVSEKLTAEWYQYMHENFYPKMKTDKNLIKTLTPPTSMLDKNPEKLPNSIHKIYFRKIFGNTILTIHDGGHGGATSASWPWIQKQKKLVDKASPETYFSVKTGTDQKFSVTASDGKGGPLTYSWNVDGKDMGITINELEYKASELGTKIVECAVKDQQGFKSLHIWVMKVSN